MLIQVWAASLPHKTHAGGSEDAEFILERIDKRWPSLVNTFAPKG